MAYEGLAEIYDYLMQDTDYEAWATYIDTLLKQYQCPGQQILDLGCGTGNISIPLLQKQWQMIGIDYSEEMLMQVAEKNSAAGTFMPLIQQDITELDLNFEVDGAIATFDTFNYILEPDDLKRVFQQLGQVIKANGVLIFDINTPFKLRQYFAQNTFTFYSDEVTYVWENYFDHDQDICEMYLTFFVLVHEAGLYRKLQESHYQKVYEIQQLKAYLEQAGFELLQIYNQLELQPLEQLAEEEKVVLVARKKDNKR